MGVHIHEAGRHAQAIGVDCAPRLLVRKPSQCDDAVALHAYVRAEPRIASAIDYFSATDQNVKHLLAPLPKLPSGGYCHFGDLRMASVTADFAAWAAFFGSFSSPLRYR